VSSFSTFFFFGAACTNPPTACCCFFNIASECDANAPPGGFDFDDFPRARRSPSPRSSPCASLARRGFPRAVTSRAVTRRAVDPARLVVRGTRASPRARTRPLERTPERERAVASIDRRLAGGAFYYVPHRSPYDRVRVVNFIP
jgi:hypothetical protein